VCVILVCIALKSYNNHRMDGVVMHNTHGMVTENIQGNGDWVERRSSMHRSSVIC